MSNQPSQPNPPAPSSPPQPPGPVEFTQYSAHPIIMRQSGFDFGKFWRSLGPLGQVSLLGGLILFLSFFLAWFTVNLTCSGAGCTSAAVNRIITQGFTADTVSPSGFTITGSSLLYRSTNDFSTGDLSRAPDPGNVPESYNFPLLWIVLLSGVALIFLPIASAQGKINPRRGHLLVLLVAGAALLIEVIYAFSALSALPLAKANASTLNVLLAARGADPGTVSLVTGVGPGFWVGLLATLLVGGAYLLALVLADRVAPPVVAASPQPQAAQFVAAQPGSRRLPEQ